MKQQHENKMMNVQAKVQKGRRGFASMDKEKQRAIASKGGKAAHAMGLAHKFTSDEAREAGRKGGLVRKIQTQNDTSV